MKLEQKTDLNSKLKHVFEIHFKTFIKLNIHKSIQNIHEIHLKPGDRNLVFLGFPIRKNDYNKMKSYICNILSPYLVEIGL